MNKKTFYVTTPIYYPSGALHIGHVYTTSLAWVLRNYKRLQGYDAIMLTGADEHGQKIEQKASQEQLSPQQYVDKMHDKFINLWKLLDIDWDFYSRTTNKKHQAMVASQFSDFLANKIIYKGKYKGLYSISDEEFLTKSQAKEVGGEFFHPLSGHKLINIEEESYFLKISTFQTWLVKYIKDHHHFIIPEKIVNELTKNFLEVGLEDLSVSRNTFSWGIQVKEDPSHVIYVWLDALNNYISALGYQSANDSNFQKYWVNGDEIIHIVGKEITRFHCIYWPIILKAAKLRLPTSIVSHGWIVTPEGKMSKSRGNVIDPLVLIKTYGEEVVKYFFVSQISLGKDGTFDEQMLKSVYNADLANNYGNLLSRTLSMIKQNFQTPIKFSESNNPNDKQLFAKILFYKKQYQSYFDKYQTKQAFDACMELSRILNGYIDKTQPWKLINDKNRLEQILNNLLQGLYAVSVFLSVVMPKKMKIVAQLLGVSNFTWDQIENFKKFDNVITQKSKILFQRIK